jgi:hypothetical protein
MPNPLSRVLPSASYEIGNVGTRTLSRRPQLAIMAVEAIAAWAHVEKFMLNMYVELAGGAQADAAVVYLAMETASAKSAAITALAERKLTPDNLNLLRVLIRVTKTAQKDRDKLAHWIWGSSDQLPDALLLADPRSLELSANKIFVYRQADFETIRVKFERIACMGMKFQFILMGHVANRDGRLFSQLCQEPEIADILNSQSQQV